jgi:hypothetical protein
MIPFYIQLRESIFLLVCTLTLFASLYVLNANSSSVDRNVCMGQKTESTVNGTVSKIIER